MQTANNKAATQSTLALRSSPIKSIARKTFAAERSISIYAASVLTQMRIDFTFVDICISAHTNTCIHGQVYAGEKGRGAVAHRQGDGLAVDMLRVRFSTLLRNN